MAQADISLVSGVTDSYAQYNQSLSPEDREAVLIVVHDLEDAKRQHDAWTLKIESWYRSYRGVLEKQAEAAQWTSKHHPPFAQSLVETVVSNMIDDRTVFHFSPRPLIDDKDTVESYVTGAMALENLVRYELEMDRFDRKQRPIALQASICGISPVKVLWDYQEGIGRRYSPQMRDIKDETGNVIAQYPYLVEQEHTRVVKDGPSVGPIDCRDFFFPDNTDDVQSARYIIHRVWMSMDELRSLQAQGVYRNVDSLSISRDMYDWERTMWRSDTLFMTNRKRKMVEVLERWGADGRVTTVANRSVLLKDYRPEENNGRQLFWHGKKPFVVVSSLPQPFQMIGVSDMETIFHLQNALWTSINQTADNVALLNNAIFIISDQVDDEQMEFAPGEFWQFENPAQDFNQWSPAPLPTELGPQWQSQIQSWLNEITGGVGTTSMAMQQMDQSTATGVSSFMSIAQRRLQARRAQFAYAYEDICDMVVSELQQFMDEDRLIPIIGKGGAQAFQKISKMQIQGRYVAKVEALSEDMMRQQKRAEAQALFTQALQGVAAASVQGTPISVEEVFKDLLCAFDKTDLEKYFLPAPPPNPNVQIQLKGQLEPGQEEQLAQTHGFPGAPQVPPPQQGPPSLTPQPLGVTGQTAAGMTSPSNQASLSPMVMLQRALALRGGGRNS